MGILERIFGKPKEETLPEPNKTISHEAPEIACDFSRLSDMAAILTNNAEKAVSDMALLSRDYNAFFSSHSEWFEKMGYSIHDFRNNYNETMLLVFAYWLCGYGAADEEASPAFGAYIDWKEETEEIISWLEKVTENLGYPIDFGEIVFNGDEFTDKALNTINSHLNAKGYTLLYLNTDGDCYHLFVIKNEDHDRLTGLAIGADFSFIREF